MDDGPPPGPPGDETGDGDDVDEVAEADDGEEADDVDEVDEADVVEERAVTRRPLPRIARSTGGEILAAAMFGLRDALEGPKKNEAAIVAEAPGEPHDPDDFDLQLDFEHPERSRVVVRRPHPNGAADGASD